MLVLGTEEKAWRSQVVQRGHEWAGNSTIHHLALVFLGSPLYSIVIKMRWRLAIGSNRKVTRADLSDLI